MIHLDEICLKKVSDQFHGSTRLHRGILLTPSTYIFAIRTFIYFQ